MSNTPRPTVMCPTDAWVIRRLLVGWNVDGSIESVSPRFRWIAERLAACPVADESADPDFREAQHVIRWLTWEAISDSLPKKLRDAMIWDLSAIDPEAPMPDPDFIRPLIPTPPGNSDSNQTA